MADSPGRRKKPDSFVGFAQETGRNFDFPAGDRIRSGKKIQEIYKKIKIKGIGFSDKAKGNDGKRKISSLYNRKNTAGEKADRRRVLKCGGKKETGKQEAEGKRMPEEKFGFINKINSALLGMLFSSLCKTHKNSVFVWE